MSNFIGVKLVDAEPITIGAYNALRGWGLPTDGNYDEPGYFIKHPDDCVTWCPKKTFERDHMPIVKGDAVTEEDLDAMIKQIHVDQVTPNDLGSIVIVTTVTLANGFTITESRTCVDPKNYDVETEVDCCIEKIKDKIWYLLRFLLSCSFNGFQKGGGK